MGRSKFGACGEKKSEVTLAKITAAQESAFIRLNELMPLAVPDLRTWAEDVGFVLGELDAMNQSSGLLAGALDLERVGVTGFSKGGAATGQFCVIDERCKAGIDLTYHRRDFKPCLTGQVVVK
ncbi:MAG: hypothetical protein JXA42_22275 [Anaerolineales bacterium]|nr:hypothetical protein [Anaerolineales bacterium]